MQLRFSTRRDVIYLWAPVFTAWFTVPSFHFSTWANLCMNVGCAGLASLAARSVAAPWQRLFLCGICVHFEWLHLPTAGTRGIFAGPLGSLLRTPQKGEGELSRAQKSKWHLPVVGGWQRVSSASTNSEARVTRNLYLALLPPRHCRFPSLKMTGTRCLRPHFLPFLLSLKLLFPILCASS